MKKGRRGMRKISKNNHPIGKPPLALNSNSKISLYPDASNFKAGTANNKILQLRNNLKR